MRYTPLVLAALVATALPSLATAQRVSADIRIGSGPIDGRILVGAPVGVHSRRIIDVGPRDYGRPAYGEVEVYRVHRGHGWWRNRGYRAVTMWYDIDRDRYYDQRYYDQRYYDQRDRDGLREVIIYERDGRYYGDRYDRRDDRGYGRSNRGRDNRYQNRDRDGGHYNRDRDDDHDNRDRD